MKRILLLTAVLLFGSACFGQGGPVPVTIPMQALKPSSADGLQFLTGEGVSNYDGLSWGTAVAAYATAQGNCPTGFCQINIPPGLTAATHFPNQIPWNQSGAIFSPATAGVVIHDLRYGDTVVGWSGNPSENAAYWAWKTWNEVYNQPAGSNGFAASQNLITFNMNLNALAGGSNYNHPGTSTNKVLWMPLDINLFKFTPGQSMGLTSSIYNYSTGDSIPVVLSSLCYGGTTAVADEGCEGGADETAAQGPVRYIGTISGGGTTGSTSITVTVTGGAGVQGAGRWLLDTQSVTSGTASAVSGSGLTTVTGTGFVASTVNTTISSGAFSAGVQTVTVASATNITTVLPLVIADQGCIEKVIPTAVVSTSVTATFRCAHYASAIVAGGGSSGLYLAFTADEYTTTVALNQYFPIVSGASGSAKLWIQSAGNYVAYNGLWTSGGTATYNIYPGAEVVGVLTSGNVSNTLTLEPNNVAWTSGDTVEEQGYPQFAMQAGTTTLTRYWASPPNNGSAGRYYNFNGLWGNASPSNANGEFGLVLNNATNTNLYTTSFFAPNGLFFNGAWNNGIQMQYGPPAGTSTAGAVVVQGCPVAGCSTNSRLISATGQTTTDNIDYNSGNTEFVISANGGGTIYHFGANGLLSGAGSVATAVNDSGKSVGVSAGTITLSGGGPTSHNFTTAYNTAPICVGSDTTAANAVKMTSASGSVTATGTSTDVINWVCYPAAN